MIKSNSKIEKFIKKFHGFEFNPKQVKEIYEFELVNKNKEFFKKCKSIVEEVKSFVQMISSHFNDIVDTLSQEDESLIQINSLKEKLSNYSNFILNANNRTKDDFIYQLLQEIKSVPEYTDTNIIQERIESESKFDHFAQLRQFYKENKSSFLSVKLGKITFIKNFRKLTFTHSLTWLILMKLFL